MRYPHLLSRVEPRRARLQRSLSVRASRVPSSKGPSRPACTSARVASIHGSIRTYVCSHVHGARAQRRVT
jgi:hypothetical protein